jgi:hypothetical protein
LHEIFTWYKGFFSFIILSHINLSDLLCYYSTWNQIHILPRLIQIPIDSIHSAPTSIMAATVESLPVAPAAAPAIPLGAQVGTRDKNVGWYTPTMETVDPAVRDLFENYSHVEPDKVVPFILEMVRLSPRPTSSIYRLKHLTN